MGHREDRLALVREGAGLLQPGGEESVSIWVEEGVLQELGKEGWRDVDRLAGGIW